MIRKLARSLASGAAFALGAALVYGGVVLAQVSGCNVLNCMALGGNDWEVGGILNIYSGGQLQIAGVNRTAALATAPAAVAAGYKIARGETALGGSNPTAVVTGLAMISACNLSLKIATAPGVGTSVVTYGSSAGTLNLYG